MIIDVSNIIGKHRFRPEITAESLLQQMDEAGITKAVISCYAESLDNESVYQAITSSSDCTPSTPGMKTHRLSWRMHWPTRASRAFT